MQQIHQYSVPLGGVELRNVSSPEIGNMLKKMLHVWAKFMECISVPLPKSKMILNPG